MSFYTSIPLIFVYVDVIITKKKITASICFIQNVLQIIVIVCLNQFELQFIIW